MTRSYRFISEHRAVFGVTRLCRVLGVRRPGFYEWLAAAPARQARTADDKRLAAEIAEVHASHRGAYGRPRIVVALRRSGRQVNHKRVGRIMREHGVVGLTRRRRRSLTRPDMAAMPVPDLTGDDAIFRADRGSQGGFNWSSQHPLISEVVDDGDGGLEQEDQRCAGGCASAVACGSGAAARDALAQAA